MLLVYTTFFSGPLWRIINKEKCVLVMSKHYQNLTECFEKRAADCIFHLNNKTFCGNSFVSHDESLESLCTPVSDEIQRMTKEWFEIIFGGFVVVSRRMLDRLMRVKPKALDLVYEEVIMFCKNKTTKWSDQLCEINIAKATECARKSKKTAAKALEHQRQERNFYKNIAFKIVWRKNSARRSSCQLKKKKL